MNQTNSDAFVLFSLPFVFILLSFNLGFSTDDFVVRRPTTNVLIQDWKQFSSAKGGFSILFPKVPNESSGTLNVGRTTVSRYTFSVRDDNLYTVMYFDVPHLDDPKAKGDLLAGFRSFVLADLKAELISDAPVSIDNNAGRLLEMSVPKRGVAKALIVVTETRLYQVTFVPGNRSSIEEDIKAASARFLESFQLSVIDRSSEGEVDAYLRMNPEVAQRAIESENPKDFLDGRALSLPKPEYPRGIHAPGTIIVRIIIDEEGKVIAAQADRGHPMLIPAAEKAARKARFSPSLEQGKPVKVLGKVRYNYLL